MANKPNTNLELQKQASKEFELQDVKKLLKKLKSEPFKIDESLFKNLDNDDNKLSDTEKQLYKKYQNAFNVIKFLEGLTIKLEEKEKEKDKFKQKRTGKENSVVIKMKKELGLETEINKNEKEKEIIDYLKNNPEIIKAKELNLKDIDKIKSLLQHTNKIYNEYYSNEYFLNNTKNLNKITDPNRIIEIFQYLKNKGKNSNNIEIKDLNPRIQQNFDVLINYAKIFKTTLNYIDIKNLNLKFLHITNSTSLRNSENISKLNSFLDILDVQTIYFLYLNNKKLFKYFNENNKSKILNIEKKYNKNDKIKQINLDNFDEIYNYIIKEDNNIKIDKLLIKLIETKGINILFKKENGKKIIDILTIDELPKTAHYLIEKNKIEELLKNDPIYTYYLLPISLQKKFALKYTEIIIKKHNKKELNNIQALREIIFPNELKETIKIFNKIKSYIPTLIESPIFRDNISQFQKVLNNKGINNELKKLNTNELDSFNEFKKYFEKELKTYNENLNKAYENEYKTKIKNPIENNEKIKKTYDKYKTTFFNTFWSSDNLDSLFSMFRKGIKNKETTQTADITNIFQILLENTINGKNTNKELNELRNKVDYETYSKILTELQKRINKTIKILNKKVSEEINDLINKNPNNKEFFKKLGLLIDNGTFGIKGEKKLKSIYEKLLGKYYKQQQKEIEQNGGKINKEQIKQNTINELLGNNNISQNLKNKLLILIKGININNSIDAINITYNNKQAYNASDEEFKKLDKKYEKNYFDLIKNNINEYEKENGEIKLGNTSFSKTNENNNILTTQNYDFNPETGTISVIENGKQEKISLTTAEKLLVQENPEIINNIIDFHKTLNELGLGKLWSIKENIFKSIENIKGIGFDIDGDYLNENEIKIFLNTILKSIGEQEISPVFNLNTFLSKIQTKNKIQIGGGEKIVNTYYGETYLENKFFEKFIGRNNTIIGFKQAEFEKSLKTNTQENVGKTTT